MNTTPSKKDPILVKRLLFVSAEGPVGRIPDGGLDLGASWEAAEKVIQRWALEQNTPGGYDKVRFQITYVDGHRYEGRIDVTRSMDNGHALANHIRAFNLNRSGRGKASEELLQATDAYEPEGRTMAARMLDEYQIGVLPPSPPKAPMLAPMTGPLGESWAVRLCPPSDFEPGSDAGDDDLESAVIEARIRKLPEAKRAALLAMLAALES